LGDTLKFILWRAAWEALEEEQKLTYIIHKDSIRPHKEHTVSLLET
jgi:hypothetical protein